MRESSEHLESVNTAEDSLKANGSILLKAIAKIDKAVMVLLSNHIWVAEHSDHLLQLSEYMAGLRVLLTLLDVTIKDEP